MIAAYAAAAPPGQPPAGHIGAVVAYVADTREQAQRRLRRELPRWLGPGLAGYRPVDGRPRSRPAILKAMPTGCARSTQSARPPTALTP